MMTESLRRQDYRGCSDVAGFANWMSPCMRGNRQLMVTTDNRVPGEYTLFRGTKSSTQFVLLRIGRCRNALCPTLEAS